MPASPMDSAIHCRLFGDAQIAALLTDEAEIAAMIRVEQALALAEGRCGVIPSGPADALALALETVGISPEELADGTARAGVSVPALLEGLRARLPSDLRDLLHWGATSQDIVDTGLVLRLRDILAILEARLAELLTGLEVQAKRHAALPMAARTRSQIATPTTFGLRIAQWRAPLVIVAGDLVAVRHRILRLQFGGAVGTLAAIHPHGAAVAAGMARELALAPALPWHVNRLAVQGVGLWCATLTDALSRIARDLMIMMRSEIGEVRAGIAGGSSTMPNKANPVGAEAVVTLATLTRSLTAALPGAQTEERDGPAWMLEWHLLPQILIATGAALNHSLDLITTLEPDPPRMAAHLESGGGAAMAEAAVFALTPHMPKADAQALVKDVLAEMQSNGGVFATLLARRCPHPVDWELVLSEKALAAPAEAMVHAMLAEGD